MSHCLGNNCNVFEQLLKIWDVGLAKFWMAPTTGNMVARALTSARVVIILRESAFLFNMLPKHFDLRTISYCKAYVLILRWLIAFKFHLLWNLIRLASDPDPGFESGLHDSSGLGK